MTWDSFGNAVARCKASGKWERCQGTKLCSEHLYLISGVIADCGWPPPSAPDPVSALSLEEKLVASTAVAEYRKAAAL